MAIPITIVVVIFLSFSCYFMFKKPAGSLVNYQYGQLNEEMDDYDIIQDDYDKSLISTYY